MSKRAQLGVVLLILIIGGAAAYFLSQAEKADKLLSNALNNAEATQHYRQTVETRMTLSERVLVVAGVYENNTETGLFSSHATTTFTVPDTGATMAFGLENMVQNDTVRVRITPIGDIRMPTPIPPFEWHSFEIGLIPRELEGIAVPGPVLDNLKIFADGGSLVELVDTTETDTQFKEQLSRYRFKRSGRTADSGGPLNAVLERIDSGTIDAWVDPETATIRHIVFSNPPYHSTTTIDYPPFQ